MRRSGWERKGGGGFWKQEENFAVKKDDIGSYIWRNGRLFFGGGGGVLVIFTGALDMATFL